MSQRQAESKQPLMPVHSSILQRQCACGGTPGPTGECEACRKRREAGLLQRAAVSPGPVNTAPPIVHEVLRSPGQPLDGATRALMEPRFGHDFSGVRVHTDAKAAQSARSVNALAYTVGQNVVFGAGKYAPTTSAGRQLLAHELTHTIQQAQQSTPGALMASSLTIGASHDPYEQEAEAQAARLVTGQTSTPIAVQGRLALARLQRQADITQAPAGLPCVLTTGPGHLPGTDIMFSVNSAGLSATQRADIAAFVRTWMADGSRDDVIVDGWASVDGPQPLNWRLSCDRAEVVKAELVAQGVPATKITTFAHGESTEFSATDPTQNRRAIITRQPAVSPPPPPPPPTPACTTVPTTTPATCLDRHNAYCAAAACFPANPWLACVCTVSGQICEAIDAFSLDVTTVPGGQLAACLAAPPSNPFAVGPTRRKGAWFLATNRCIWGHWRAALDAIHDPTLPIPGGLTAEWAAAVAVCRSSGVGSSDCCRAHVVAEQQAIDHCGRYDSSAFGTLPTDVPRAPACSAVAARFAPGPAFTGDFGNVSDRIAFGNRRCSC